jgi:hypothetical protein
VALAAWPIWHYQQEYVLFQRRAVLERATREGSAIRDWLWSGRVLRSLQVFVALVLASLLLSFSVLLRPEHWLVLAADVLMLALVVGPVRRRLASQVWDQQLGVLVRRWLLFLLNLLFLTACFFVIDFFFVGAPDTRDIVIGDGPPLTCNKYLIVVRPLLFAGTLENWNSENLHALLAQDFSFSECLFSSFTPYRTLVEVLGIG